MTLDEILTLEESQTFDRKSVNIAPRDLSSHICAFAKADGGVIAIGVSDRNRRIEGVDRMCREMEESGLPKPEFKQSGFILKAIVKNTDFEGKILGIELKRHLIDFVKATRLNFLTQENILAIVREMKISQVFGLTDVQKALDCVPATATNVVKKMKNLGIIVPVTGRGKGKYQLKEGE